jgi:hypothetical protein
MTAPRCHVLIEQNRAVDCLLFFDTIARSA